MTFSDLTKKLTIKYLKFNTKLIPDTLGMIANRSSLKIILSVIVISISFFSCQSENEASVYNIGFSQAMTTDNWRRAMNKEMEVESSMHPNLKFEIRDAENNVDLQIQQIEKFISDQVDVLIVSPIQSAPVTPVIEKAMNSGIPTIVIDRKIESRNYTAYVGANNIQIGESAAKDILTRAKEPLKVVEIKGQEGSSPASERSEGFRKILEGHPSIEVEAVINGKLSVPHLQMIHIPSLFSDLLVA